MHKVRCSPRKGKQTSNNKTTPPTTPIDNAVINETMSTAKSKTSPARKKILRSSGKKNMEQEIISDIILYDSSQQDDDETKASETNSTLSSSSFDTSHENSLYQPVGQQLLEQLDKGKKRRSNNGKPLRRASIPPKVCNNCGTTAVATRAKKCQNCGQFFSVSLAKRYSNEPCPNCHQVPKFSRVGRPSICPNCQKPLLDTAAVEDISNEDLESSLNTSFSQDSKDVESNEATIDLTTQETVEAFPSSISHSVGYVPKMMSTNEPVDLVENQSNEMSSSNEELKKLLKRKILNNTSAEPPNKKPHIDGEIDESLPTSCANSPPQNLSVSLPSSLIHHSAPPILESISSPLLEYAQKISARVMIPPEISPQNTKKTVKQTKRGNKTNKSSKGKQQQTKSDTVPLKAERGTSPLSPISTTAPSEQNVVNRSNSVPPPPLHSDEILMEAKPQLTVASPLISPSTGYSFEGRITSSTNSMATMTTTAKPHDPTINSIRTFSSYHYPMTPPLYAQPTIPPPLIPPIGNPAYHMIPHDVYSTHSPLDKPPPLVPVSHNWTNPQQQDSWYYTTGSNGGPIDNAPPVAHRTVIVDPIKVKDNISVATTSAPPSLEVTTAETTEDDELTQTEEQYTTDIENIQQHEQQLVQHDIHDEDATVKERVHKHSKRKQKLMLSDMCMSQDDEEVSEVKKKKKKKKKKEREKGESHHHSKHRGESSDKASDKKLKKKKKKKERDLESASQTEDEELQQTIENNEDNEDSSSNLFSVKIIDLTVHRLKWDQYTMTLLIPSDSSANVQETTPTKVHETTPVDTPTQGSVQEETVSGETRTLRSGKKRLRETIEEKDETQEMEEEGIKKKRKGKLKQEVVEQSNTEIETNSQKDTTEAEDIIDTYYSNIPPSFSVFELRNKLFSDFPPRTVHAFTYKLKIKTHRPPLHWIHVLKRVGGLPDSCHTCRLLDVEAVKQMCEQNKIDVPSSVDKLLNNQLGNRKLIDLSVNDANTIISRPELLHYNIPQCSFNDTLPRKKSTRQKVAYHKFLAHQDTPAQKGVKPVSSTPVVVAEQDQTKEEQKDEQEEHEEEQEQEEDEDEEEIVEEEEEEEEEEIERGRNRKSRSVKKPPPLLSVSSDAFNDSQNSGAAAGGGGRKKPCTHCGMMVLCKSKKCRNCGKLFGVFTFGRRMCTNCGHINLARMTSCFKCSTPLDKAPTAKPKDVDSHEIPKSDHVGPSGDYRTSKVDFKFGVRKKRLRFHTTNQNSASLFHVKQSEGIDGIAENEDMELDSPPLTSNDKKRSNSKKDQQQLAGYQYGKIPWSDADLALLITSIGTPKFCLQEVCNKVLRYHNKTDVFEMVKNLHLQLEQGNGILLRKLQALGLHPNRSPICKLITAEDLFALMDALEEPVPEEVHQHLESVSLNSTPLSPSSPTQANAHLLSSFNAVPLVSSSLIEEEADNEFESTLHEVKCSDGQSLSMLRSWDGTHFLCLLEVWRRYFPEVNRSHLSAVIKKMLIETHIPTSQQTNLLRAANVISMRGAPGRLIKLQDVQRLLDDFGIPLQIGADLDKTPEKISIHSRPIPRRCYPRFNMGRPLSGISSAEANRRNDLANCMDTLLDVLQPSDLTQSLDINQQEFQKDVVVLDEQINALSFKLDLLKNALYGGRDLCQTLCDEIGFLTVVNHSHMAEIVRLDHDLSQSLHEVDLLIDHSKLQALIEL